MDEDELFNKVKKEFGEAYPFLIEYAFEMKEILKFCEGETQHN